MAVMRAVLSVVQLDARWVVPTGVSKAVCLVAGMVCRKAVVM
jgi:hypothetical protein